MTPAATTSSGRAPLSGTHVRGLITAAGAALLFLLGGVLFPSTGHDDSYISFWPAWTLATSGAIENYNGEPVEQSSSLFHVLLLGLGHALTRIPIPVLATVVGALAGLGSALVAGRLASRHAPAAAPLAVLLVATCPSVVYWSFGRLETPFVALLGGVAILAYAGYLAHGRALGWPAVATLLFVLVRPEAPVVLLCVLVGALVLRPLMPEVPARRLAILTGVVVGCAALVMGARLLLFGSPFPQPVHAKAGGITAEDVRTGLGYVMRAGAPGYNWPLTLANLSVVASVAWWVARVLPSRNAAPASLLAFLYVVATVSFIVLSGGDWMFQGRFLAHVLPIALVFPAVAVASVTNRHVRLLLALGLVLAQVGGMLLIARSRSVSVPAWAVPSPVDGGLTRWLENANQVHTRDRPVVDYLDGLLAALPPPPDGRLTAMSNQMGFITYQLASTHPGEIEFVDLKGLIEPTFTSCPLTASRGHTPVGLDFNYEPYFALRPELERECGVPRPEVIFDYYLPKRGLVDALDANGYVLKLAQVGPRPSPSRLLPGNERNQGQFVAVRADLLTPGDTAVVWLRAGRPGSRPGLAR